MAGEPDPRVTLPAGIPTGIPTGYLCGPAPVLSLTLDEGHSWVDRKGSVVGDEIHNAAWMPIASIHKSVLNQKKHSLE